MLTPGFLTKVGSIRVERVPAHDFGDVDLSKAPVGVGHTTEGSFESALQKFESVDAPHFLVGADRKGKVRICQLVALGRTAGALEHNKGTVETNRWARAQIELAGFSKKSAWLPNQDVLDAFTQLVAALRGRAGIPLHRPFPDAMIPAGIIWATTKNPRRKSGHWGTLAGWWNHLEVPGNAHWDMGAFRWTPVLKNAQSLVKPAPEARPTTLPSWFWPWVEWRLGEGEFKSFGAAAEKHRPKEAPRPIPDWAWKRFAKFVADRKPKR